MTLYFKNHEITIYRKRRKGTTDRYAFSATFTAYQADIQSSSIQRQQFLGARYGSVYDGYLEIGVVIKEGDQVVDDDGKRYSVMGVSHWEGAGMLDHTEVTLVSVDG